jgi:hypothetical protein
LYPYEYQATGVEVKPRPSLKGVPISHEALYRQFLETTEAKTNDIELLLKMAFDYLELKSSEGPPDPPEEPHFRERYIIYDENRRAFVFCLECKNELEPNQLGAVVARSLELKRQSTDDVRILLIVNHQRLVPKAKRAIAGGIPEDAHRVINSCGFTAMTALDLQLLVRGHLELKWPLKRIKAVLFAAGRQGTKPPNHSLVGRFRMPFPKISVMSVSVASRSVLSVGDRIVTMVGLQYVEDTVSSMQLDGQSVTKVKGPCNVGIATKLKLSALKAGQPVYKSWSKRTKSN